MEPGPFMGLACSHLPNNAQKLTTPSTLNGWRRTLPSAGPRDPPGSKGELRS